MDENKTPESVVATGLIIRLTQMSGWILRTITSLFENIGTLENGMETISKPHAVVDRHVLGAEGGRPVNVDAGPPAGPAWQRHVDLPSGIRPQSPPARGRPR